MDFDLPPSVDEIRQHLLVASAAGRELSPDLHILRPGLLVQWTAAYACGLTPNPLRQGVDATNRMGEGIEIKAVHRNNPVFTVDYGRKMLLKTDYAKIRRHASFLFATLDDSLEVVTAVSVPAAVVLSKVQAIVARTTRNRVAWLPQLGEVATLGRMINTSGALPEPLVRARHAVGQAQSIASSLNPPVSSILLKGRMKELILASALGHELVINPKLEDARDYDGRPCEYLCSDTPGERADFVVTHLSENNLYRISRNTGGVFCATWGPDLLPREIWRLDAAAVLAFIERTVMPFRANVQNQMHLRGRDAHTLGELVYSRADA